MVERAFGLEPQNTAKAQPLRRIFASGIRVGTHGVGQSFIARDVPAFAGSGSVYDGWRTDQWRRQSLQRRQRGGQTPAQAVQIETALVRVGLAGMGARKPGQLSGGQQGRAALARALLRARPVLLLDEPFAALGPALKAEMLDLLDEVAAATGAAVLMVTHDPNDAKRFADKTVLVADRVAQAPVATAELFANPPQALRDYLG